MHGRTALAFGGKKKLKFKDIALIRDPENGQTQSGQAINSMLGSI